jgi:hypothetical protein
MRDDPDPEGTASLVVETAADADVALADVVADLDGELVREGRFVTVVELPEPRVAALCAVEGLARVETTDTLGLALTDDRDPDPDAGSGSGSGPE